MEWQSSGKFVWLTFGRSYPFLLIFDCFDPFLYLWEGVLDWDCCWPRPVWDFSRKIPIFFGMPPFNGLLILQQQKHDIFCPPQVREDDRLEEKIHPCQQLFSFSKKHITYNHLNYWINILAYYLNSKSALFCSSIIIKWPNIYLVLFNSESD